MVGEIIICWKQRPRWDQRPCSSADRQFGIRCTTRFISRQPRNRLNFLCLSEYFYIKCVGFTSSLLWLNCTYFTEDVSFLCIYLKTVHKNQLHPSLGHPDNLLQLDTLCQEEIKRQKDQADGIHLNTQMLQVIVKPLLNMNLDVAFGKESTSWIHFSSPSKVNWKMF